MNTKFRENNSGKRVRKVFRRPVHRHDPMLVLNISIFNFTDGWNRTFAKYQYVRSYA